METLEIDDLHNLNQSIQKLYTLHDFDIFNVTALSIVDRLVPGDIPEFHLTNLRTRQILSTFLPDFCPLIKDVSGSQHRVTIRLNLLFPK